MCAHTDMGIGICLFVNKHCVEQSYQNRRNCVAAISLWIRLLSSVEFFYPMLGRIFGTTKSNERCLA
jgi:hypothetical protein